MIRAHAAAVKNIKTATENDLWNLESRMNMDLPEMKHEIDEMETRLKDFRGSL